MRRHGKPPTRSAITLTRECVLTGLAGKGSADVRPHTLGAPGRPHGSLACIRGPAPMSASGHFSDMPTAWSNVRVQKQSRPTASMPSRSRPFGDVSLTASVGRRVQWRGARVATKCCAAATASEQPASYGIFHRRVTWVGNIERLYQVARIRLTVPWRGNRRKFKCGTAWKWSRLLGDATIGYVCFWRRVCSPQW